MTFQASDGKGRNFLDLINDNYKVIKLSYIKESPWLQAFGSSDSLCTHTTRAITNHTPIGEYRLCFFPNEEFKCPCGLYPIETRRYILHECIRHNGYWNPRRDSLSHFVMFLSANPKAFAFNDNFLSVVSSWTWCDLYSSFPFLVFLFPFYIDILSSSFSFSPISFPPQFPFLHVVCILCM